MSNALVLAGIHRVAEMLENDGLSALPAAADIVGPYVAAAMAITLLRIDDIQHRDCGEINESVLHELPELPTVTLPPHKQLTPTEMKVLHLVASEGLQAKEAARRAGMSPRTIEEHCRNLRTKLGARNVIDMTRIFMLHRFAGTNLATPPPS